jgi:putative acetyltransferase
VERAAREQGAGYVDLWSDVKFETAHRFYERRGYSRDGRTRELDDESDTVEYHFRREL